MTSKKLYRERLLRVIAAFFILLIGGCIYLIYRPQSVVLNQIFDKIFDKTNYDALRSYISQMQLHDIIIYSLPGGLWTIAYILVSDAIFINTSYTNRLKWASAIPLIGVVSELLQACRLLPGVFDLYDLFFYAVPYLIYYLLLTKKAKTTK